MNLTSPELFQKIEQYLCRPLMEGIPPTRKWFMVPGGTDRYRKFELNLLSNFILIRKPPLDPEKPVPPLKDIKKLEKEFYHDLFKKSREVLKALHHDVPYSLRVLISEKDEVSCVCEAECKPVLHEQLRTRLVSMRDVPKDRRHDSYNESVRFLDEVFIGSLGAEHIPDVFLEGPQFEVPAPADRKEERVYERGQIYDFYRDILDITQKAKNEIFVIDAYIDEDALNLYLDKISPDIRIRILTNKPQGNFVTVARKFKAKPNVAFQVRQSRDCHDRLFFVDSTCWAMGQSIKDAGKKPTYLVRIQSHDLFRRVFEKLWNTSSVMI